MKRDELRKMSEDDILDKINELERQVEDLTKENENWSTAYDDMESTYETLLKAEEEISACRASAAASEALYDDDDDDLLDEDDDDEYNPEVDSYKKDSWDDDDYLPGAVRAELDLDSMTGKILTPKKKEKINRVRFESTKTGFHIGFGHKDS